MEQHYTKRQLTIESLAATAIVAAGIATGLPFVAAGNPISLSGSICAVIGWAMICIRNEAQS